MCIITIIITLRMIPQAKFAETNIISNRYTTTPRAATAASAATTSTSSTSAGELPPSTSTTTASVMSPDADGWFKGYVIDDFDPNFFRSTKIMINNSEKL